MDAAPNPKLDIGKIAELAESLKTKTPDTFVFIRETFEAFKRAVAASQKITDPVPPTVESVLLGMKCEVYETLGEAVYRCNRLKDQGRRPALIITDKPIDVAEHPYL